MRLVLCLAYPGFIKPHLLVLITENTLVGVQLELDLEVFCSSGNVSFWCAESKKKKVLVWQVQTAFHIISKQDQSRSTWHHSLANNAHVMDSRPQAKSSTATANTLQVWYGMKLRKVKHIGGLYFPHFSPPSIPSGNFHMKWQEALCVVCSVTSDFWESDVILYISLVGWLVLHQKTIGNVTG